MIKNMEIPSAIVIGDELSMLISALLSIMVFQNSLDGVEFETPSVPSSSAKYTVFEPGLICICVISSSLTPLTKSLKSLGSYFGAFSILRGGALNIFAVANIYTLYQYFFKQ